jgi:hypothetical protein
MPIYEIQTAPDVLRRKGAIFPVEISIPQTLRDYLTAQKMRIPPPVSGSALIDSGASISAIDLSVVSALQISPMGVATILTPAGPAKQNLFPARFELPRLRIDISAVLGVDVKPQGIIALIGRDILSRFLMIYHGPGGRVTLSF